MVDNPLDLEAFRDSLPKGAFWVTGELFHRLIDVIIGDRAKLSDQSATMTKFVDGRVFNILEGQGGGGGGSPRGFKCEVDETGLLIRVRYGVIGSTAPAGMNSGDDPIFTIPPVGGSGVVMIAATAGDLGDGVIGAVSAEIQCGFAVGADNSPENVYYLQIGSYNTVGGVLVVESDGDGVGYQQFKLCGGLGGEPEWGPA